MLIFPSLVQILSLQAAWNLFLQKFVFERIRLAMYTAESVAICEVAGIRRVFRNTTHIGITFVYTVSRACAETRA